MRTRGGSRSRAQRETRMGQDRPRLFFRFFFRLFLRLFLRLFFRLFFRSFVVFLLPPTFVRRVRVAGELGCPSITHSVVGDSNWSCNGGEGNSLLPWPSSRM